MPEGSTKDGIGASVRRKEDKRFLTGSGRYTADISRHGQLHVHFIRSDHAHANIKSIKTDDAAKACARIDAHDRTVVLDDLRVTMRVHMLIHDAFDIRRDHTDTVRFVALEVSLDQVVGNCVSMG